MQSCSSRSAGLGCFYPTLPPLQFNPVTSPAAYVVSDEFALRGGCATIARHPPQPAHKLAKAHTRASALATSQSGVAPSALTQVHVRGINVSLDHAARFAPVVTFHPNEKFLPCSAEYLLAGATLHDDKGQVIVTNPTPADLAKYPDPFYRLQVNRQHDQGQPVTARNTVAAPMYVAVQVPETRAYVDMRYVFLFNYQGPQTARVLVPTGDYDCVLPNFGEHEGDVEGVTVRLSSDLQRVQKVIFEHHGQSQVSDAEDVQFEGTHPVVRCALNGHATFNAKGKLADDRVIEPNETRDYWGFGVQFMDLISNAGPRWAPFDTGPAGATDGQLVFIGLDATKKPINCQDWVAFAGRLGAAKRNDFVGAQGVGKPLSWIQRTYVNALARGVVAAGKVEEKRRLSDGPEGLGGRPEIVMEPSDI